MTQKKQGDIAAVETENGIKWMNNLPKTSSVASDEQLTQFLAKLIDVSSFEYLWLIGSLTNCSSILFFISVQNLHSNIDFTYVPTFVPRTVYVIMCLTYSFFFFWNFYCVFRKFPIDYDYLFFKKKSWFSSLNTYYNFYFNLQFLLDLPFCRIVCYSSVLIYQWTLCNLNIAAFNITFSVWVYIFHRKIAFAPA